ncbi:MAG TPA: right-handed parallel beta-helix repeat-containing protein [Myxococcota bacterium]|nr:right-handed parallel beta-helix repeat-containing protein [Myxococcota bacterium]
MPASGCQVPETTVRVTFPDDAALQATYRLAFWVFDAEDPGAPTCEQLLAFFVSPNAVGLPRLAQADVAFPATEPPRLSGVRFGAVAVYVEAYDVSDQRFLFGCSTGDVARGGGTIAVDLVPSLVLSCAGQPNGTPCEDGLFCTTGDTCNGNQCRDGGPRDCSAVEEACAASTCNEAAGTCDAVPQPDGAPCEDGLACTSGETCAGGACGGGLPTDCGSFADTCNDAGCAEAMGGCFSTAHADGTPCNDATACTGPDTCGAGACGGPPLCAADTPPLARFTVTPGAGTPGSSFSFDAAASADLEDADAALTFDWDWESDGTFDASGIAATHAYAAAGLQTITLRATDPVGLSAEYTGFVVVDEPADLLIVTTAIDVVDATDGETSLREAITSANGAAAPRTITFSAPMTIALGSPLPALGGGGGIALVGRPGVVLDGAALVGVQDCLSITSDGNTVLWLDVQNCADDGIVVSGGMNWVALSAAHSVGGDGLSVTGASCRLGPNVSVFLCSGDGAHVGGAMAIVEDSVFFSNTGAGVACAFGASGVAMRGNFVYGNGVGLNVNGTVSGALVWHNTVRANAGDGLVFGASTAVEVRDNVFSENGDCGVSSAATFAALDHNDYFMNPLGACCGCPAETAALTDDPLFVAPGADDLRVRAASPCVDAGGDTGLDRNGSLAGTFNGAAPDVGAWESP